MMQPRPSSDWQHLDFLKNVARSVPRYVFGRNVAFLGLRLA